MAVGITQPGGAGTTIFIYDDASSILGTGYRFSEISAAFPADFVDNGATSGPSYRAKVDLQLGDTGIGTATTSLVDTDQSFVAWDSTKTLKNRTTQTTSWVYNFGTKVGTGNEAGGVKGSSLVFGAATALTGIHSWYGCLLRQTNGALTLSTPTDGVGEMINCILQSSAGGVAPVNIGSGNFRFANVFRVGISHTTTGNISTNLGMVNGENITIAGSGPNSFASINSGNTAFKDITFFGSPISCDLRWAGINSTAWRLYRPEWSGNGPKFLVVTPGIPPLDGVLQTIEYRRATMKACDRNGNAVAGIPMQLSDQFGNIFVSGTTDANGGILFGSGAAANMIPVMDHYANGSVYAQRHRSPFTLRCNTPDLAGFNSNYLARIITFNWPGYEGIGLSTGQFEDMGFVFSIENPVGSATEWVELEV